MLVWGTKGRFIPAVGRSGGPPSSLPQITLVGDHKVCSIPERRGTSFRAALSHPFWSCSCRDGVNDLWGMIRITPLSRFHMLSCQRCRHCVITAQLWIPLERCEQDPQAFAFTFISRRTPPLSPTENSAPGEHPQVLFIVIYSSPSIWNSIKGIERMQVFFTMAHTMICRLTQSALGLITCWCLWRWGKKGHKLHCSKPDHFGRNLGTVSWKYLNLVTKS